MKVLKTKMNDAVILAMQQCVLMQTEDSKDFNNILEISRVKKYSENETLFLQGSRLEYFFLVVSGGVKLQRLAPNGNEKVIKIVHPKQTFAEAAVFSNSPVYPVSAVAVAQSVVVAIKAEPYTDLIKCSRSLSFNLLGNLSMKLHWMIDEVDRLTLHNVSYRLVNYLLSHIPEEAKGKHTFKFAAPKNVIASRLSIKPETLSRTLKDLTSKKLICLQDKTVTIIDVETLRLSILL